MLRLMASGMPSALSAVARQLRWQAVRIEDADLAVDEGLQHLVIAAVDEEALRQAEQQARENSRLMQTVGAGALSLAAMALNDMIDSTTGELKRPLEPRDMPALMRVGARSAGHGSSGRCAVQSGETTGPSSRQPAALRTTSPS
jgi:hypothetical protein